MQFGNWKVTDTGIEWAGQGFQRFVIEKQFLPEMIKVQEAPGDLYKWLVLATAEDWLTADDLYDLNFAFVYASGASQVPFDYQVFDRTVEYQYDLLDEEENEL